MNFLNHYQNNIVKYLQDRNTLASTSVGAFKIKSTRSVHSTLYESSIFYYHRKYVNVTFFFRLCEYYYYYYYYYYFKYSSSHVMSTFSYIVLINVGLPVNLRIFLFIVISRQSMLTQHWFRRFNIYVFKLGFKFWILWI